jgi:REP element-mobilizing transposase RayT
MPAHASNLRRGRFSQPGQIYLITTVCQNRAPVFADLALARLAIAELQRCDELGHCRTQAYVLMPDHLHWLLQLEAGELSSLVGRLKANTAKVINWQLGRPGVALWQPGFHDHAIRQDEDLAGIARYIVTNPLRAGRVQRVGDYPHWDAIWL